MVEVIVAMFITMVAVISLLSMIPMSWQTVSKSDYLGRATGLLQDELEWRQYQTMRGVDPTTLENPDPGKIVTLGDIPFTVITTTSKDNLHPNTWLVNVKITWRGNDNGITSSMIMTRQSGFNNLDNS